jgi:hypothetical protein
MVSPESYGFADDRPVVSLEGGTSDYTGRHENDGQSGESLIMEAVGYAIGDRSPQHKGRGRRERVFNRRCEKCRKRYLFPKM